MAGQGISPIVDKAPAISGIETTDYWPPHAVYGHTDALGEQVVVIGGSDTSCETAWYLVLAGKQVT